MPISPILTPITCPNCKQGYTAPVEQVFDAGEDPAAKLRILRGHFNQFTCPHCRFTTRVNAPLLYHDPDKSLLLTYVPMEMGLTASDQERIIGRMVQQVIQSLPAEKRKGYLLTPQSVLTLQGLVDRILDADGITAEVREAQRAKAALLQQLMTADEASLPELVTHNDAALDQTFFEMLTASAEMAAAEGDPAAAQQLIELRARLLELSSLGQQARGQAKLLDDTARELEALGDKLTQAKFLDLVTASPNEDRVAALIALARPLADYGFFQKLSERLNRAQGAERERLTQLRETVLRLTQEIDAAAEARLQQTTAVIREMLSATDPRPVIEKYLPLVDENFLAMLRANAEHAARSGRADVAERLQGLSDVILSVLAEAAPPEIRFINELLAADSLDTAQAMLKNRAAEITPAVVDMMRDLGAELRQNGQAEAAERLAQLADFAGREAAAARWR